METLIKKYYPQATIERSTDKIDFSYNTQEFLIHLPDKTGQWQEARPLKGPQDHTGIVGSASIQPGLWDGAAMVPQSFDRYYFTALLMAPYSKNCDCHLVAHLDYPKEVSQEFLQEWRNLINSFANFPNEKK